MCGINCIDWDDKKKILSMNESIIHRGPDQQGVFVDGNISLGHVRLSILDLSEKGKQPMLFEDLVIVYNGEIYNFKELREELVRAGYTFDSSSDTEVILKGYDCEGKNFFKKLNGIFAFVIYDKKKKELVAMRDRLGIKPLYYYKDKHRLIITSETKVFPENFSDELEFWEDKLEIWQYLLNDTVAFESFIEPVKALVPGNMYRYSVLTKKLECERFIDVHDVIDKEEYLKNSKKTEHELINELDALLNRVVQRQMVSDVPVGTICSGGLDSSLITAIARRYSKNIKVYNVKVKDPRYDESRYAKIVADHLGLKFETLLMDADVFRRNFKDCTYYGDSPLVYANSVGIYLITKKAKKDGVTVLLSGEGADESFGGYGVYKELHRQLILNDLVLINRVKRILWRLPYLFLNRKTTLVDHFISYRDIHKEFPTHLNPPKQIFRRAYNMMGFIKNRNERAAMSLLATDLRNRIVALLQRTDRMSMMAGVEARVPFLDNEILDFVLNLPFKYKNKKYLLKKVAERYLPKEIVYRRKVGFEFPYEDWLDTRSPRYLFYQEWRKNYFKER